MMFPAKDDGYRGLWSCRGSTLSHDEYVYTHYSGGFATAFAKHIPLAVYAREVDKTFFCYAGVYKDKNRLLITASYYDHARGTVPRPTVIMDKDTDDAHDNPVISINEEGFVLVFASAHGTARPAYIYRSLQPYSVDSFELIQKTNFSYPQVWYLVSKGFFFLHTRYFDGCRFLYWMTSRDGATWSEPKLLAHVARGHYQISWPCKNKVGTAFNYHTEPKGADSRTNLYYAETDDFGDTWKSANGERLDLPLEAAENKALIHNYESEKYFIYLKDINFDKDGNPIILFIASRGAESGPKHGKRIWKTARWTGNNWEILDSLSSDNNYDTGCIHIEQDGIWRIIGPSETGPQPYNAGGEIAVWTSVNKGESWAKEIQVTTNSPFNHTYVRRPLNAHPDFYAFWADGHARSISESHLYFCNKTGMNLYYLPYKMTADAEKPKCIMS